MLRIGKKILKILAYIVGSVVLLLVIIALLVQTPPVQDFVKEKALSFFRDKVDSKADIERFWLDFPHDLVVEGLYLEDQEEDTLAYVEELRVSAEMWGLLKGKLDISQIGIKGFVGYMTRYEADSAFNFDFIIEAFTVPPDSAAAPKDTTSNFALTIDEVNINNSRFYYEDPIAGFEMAYGVGNLDVEISKFNLDSMRLHISDIILEDSYGKFVQTREVPDTDEPTEPFAFDLEVKDVAINNVRFRFESIPAELELFTEVGNLSGRLETIDILNMDYIADELNLENTVVELDLHGQPDEEVLLAEEASALDTVILNVGANKLSFNNLSFRFDDHTGPEAPGFDPMHFAFAEIRGEFTDPEYRLEGTDSYASGQVEHLTLKEEAGMSLDKLEGIVEFTPTHTMAQDMELVAGNSQFSGDFRISYESLEAMASSPGQLGLEMDLNPSRIYLDDVIYFVPDMAEQLSILPAGSRSINLQGQVNGQISALNIPYFKLNGLNNTRIELIGQLNGIPDVQSLYTNLTLRQFTTTRTDIEAILPDTLLPENITIPESVAIQGTIEGTLNEAEGNLDIITSMGNAALNGAIEMQEDSVYAYTGHVEVNEFNLGKLLQQEEMMGKLSLNLDADGQGFTLDEINTELQGVVSSFTYNGYTYNDLKINGNIFKREFSGDLAMSDANLDFTFEGTVNMNDSIPEFMFSLDLNQADLQALNFMDEPLRVEGVVDSDIRARNFEQFSGFLNVEDVVIYKNDKPYYIDSLMFSSVKSGRQTVLTVKSDILEANFEGEFEVIKLPSVIQAHINQYYELMDATSLEGIEPQSFTFNIDIKRTGLLTDVLVPDLKTLTPGEISGVYNSQDWSMDIRLEVIEIEYANIIMDSLRVNVVSNEASLNYDARLASLRAGFVPIENIWLEGLVASNHINTALHIQDSIGNDKFLYGGIFTTWEEQYYQLQMTPGRIIMNYDPWKVYPGNSIRFFPSGIIIEDFRLTKDEQQIAVESIINPEQDTLINLSFNKFNLEIFNDLAVQDTIFISGLLNGKAELNTSAEILAFTSNMGIRNLAYKRDTLGNLSINAYSSGGKRYNVTASLDGYNSMMLIEGYYEADSTAGIIHFDADLDKLDFSVVEAFSFGELSQSRGYLTGDMAIRGTVANPDIHGEIGFRNVMTNVTYLKSWMLINDEKITFDRQGIHLDQFTINDGSGNDFNIYGNILTQDYSYFRLNLNARMNNFLMLNTGAGDNPLFYGTLIVDSDIRVTGDSELPIINMNINLNDESRITYIVPEAEIATIEREGLIEFIDQSAKNFGTDSLMASDTLESRMSGIDFTANINVDQSNTFTVVIDPATGDRLSNLRGSANLALNINPTGDISLNGRYTVEEGLYTMRFFGLARREFSIVEGSYILWTGDPLNARLDIKAEYEVLASPQPLAGNLQAGALNQYAKQPILVYLDLEGRLLSPEIAFELSMPEDEQRSNVMALLHEINSQESRLLEEVLSLVVFRRFSGGNILAGGGGGAESTARQSVSRVLSQQLNQLGAQIQGVDLSFDVQSYQDYSQTGEAYNRTAVELGLSKRFFNDRVNVKVAGNFDVEGEKAQQQNNMSDFAGDIVVEYLITEDGRFRLLGFRKNEYDDLLQGEIVETGIGILFVKEYDSFKELFSALNNTGG